MPNETPKTPVDERALSREANISSEELSNKLGEISVDNVLAEEAKYNNLINHANAELVIGVVGRLPYSQNGTSMSAPNASEARKIQANIVWFRDSIPYYIVGKHGSESGKWTDLLLVGGTDYPHKQRQIMITTVRTKIFEKGRDEADINLNYRDIPQDVIDGMLDKEKDELVIYGHTPGSIPLKGIRRTFQSFNDGVPACLRLEHGVTEGQMRDFEVASHLQDLAKVFDQEDEYHKLQAKRDELPNISPLDQYNQQ